MPNSHDLRSDQLQPRDFSELDWEFLHGFPGYMINRAGEIRSERSERILRPSFNNYGNLKIALMDESSGERLTRGVAKLVIDQFHGPHENTLFDSVICLDGNPTNVALDNLAWRPYWFAWKYKNQFSQPIPRHYTILPLLEYTSYLPVDPIARYKSVVDAAVTQGLLFADIWVSTYKSVSVFPHNYYYVIAN